MRAAIAAMFAVVALAACDQVVGPSAEGAKPSETEAAQAELKGIHAENAWAAATMPGSRVSAGYFMLKGGLEDDRLLSASSPRAVRMEIHEMAMDGAVMRMRQLPEGVLLPAGGAVEMKPGGLHLMFFDIPTGFSVGETIPVMLTFEKEGVVKVDFTVRERESASGEHTHGG